MYEYITSQFMIPFLKALELWLHATCATHNSLVLFFNLFLLSPIKFYLAEKRTARGAATTTTKSKAAKFVCSKAKNINDSARSFI